MSKILVTGGAGFIGSHTAIELINSGYEPVIIDNLSNSSPEPIKRIKKISGFEPKFYKFDLCDKEKLDDFFKKNKIDVIIHFAALKAVGESVAKPLLYYRNNLLSLMNILELMDKHALSDIVFSSSCAVYGEPEKKPVAESAPIQKSSSPYGNTKKIGEEILRDAGRAGNYRIIALRYFNVVGAHVSGKIGELPIGVPANLFPFITQTAIGKRKELSIFGKDYPTRDGTAVRDYIHVMDLAKAHVKAAKRLAGKESKEAMEIFNLGAGRGYSVREVVDMFERISRKKLPCKLAPRRPGDIAEIYADPGKANKVLKWRAELGLKEMLESAWEWEKYHTRQNKT